MKVRVLGMFLVLWMVLLSPVPAFASTNLISGFIVNVSSGYGVAGGAANFLTDGNLTQSFLYQGSIDFWQKFSVPVSVTGYEFYGSGSVNLDLYNSSGTVIWSGLVSAYGSVVPLTLSQDVAGFDLGNGSGGATYTQFELFGPSLPSVPSGLAVSGSGAGGNLSWNANSASDGVTSYNVYQNGVKVGSASGTSYSLSGLGVGTYSLAVSAVNSVGESALSPAVSYVVQGVPGIVTGLSCSGGGASSGVLSWAANAVSDNVRHYNVYQNGALMASPTTNSYNFSGLGAGTDSFTVSAVNAVGEGPLASPLEYSVAYVAPVSTTTANFPKNAIDLGVNLGDIFAAIAIFFGGFWPIVVLVIVLWIVFLLARRLMVLGKSAAKPGGGGAPGSGGGSGVKRRLGSFLGFGSITRDKAGYFGDRKVHQRLTRGHKVALVRRSTKKTMFGENRLARRSVAYNVRKVNKRVKFKGGQRVKNKRHGTYKLGYLRKPRGRYGAGHRGSGGYGRGSGSQSYRGYGSRGRYVQGGGSGSFRGYGSGVKSGRYRSSSVGRGGGYKASGGGRSGRAHSKVIGVSTSRRALQSSATLRKGRMPRK